ncbi:hypothetical protein BGW80DRAFT_497384 [Lactifluus volemus]|nr:hypothetical protein BGW80DRAFT_497384 [Lactifluus volemus]
MGGIRRPGRTCDMIKFLFHCISMTVHVYIHHIYFPGDLRRDDGVYLSSYLHLVISSLDIALLSVRRPFLPRSPRQHASRIALFGYFFSQTPQEPICRKWAGVVNTTRQRPWWPSKMKVPWKLAVQTAVLFAHFPVECAEALLPSPTSFAPETFGPSGDAWASWHYQVNVTQYHCLGSRLLFDQDSTTHPCAHDPTIFKGAANKNISLTRQWNRISIRE